MRRPGPLGRWLAWAAMGLAALGLAGSVWAQAPKKAAKAEDPDVLRSELDQLRIMYKDDHPDVIKARRALERAQERARERQAEKARPAGPADSQER